MKYMVIIQNLEDKMWLALEAGAMPINDFPYTTELLDYMDKRPGY